MTSLVPRPGFHRARACPDPWRSLPTISISIYYQYLLIVSLGRVLLQNLVLFDLIERLQEADETGQRGSGQGVTVPLLNLGVIY